MLDSELLGRVGLEAAGRPGRLDDVRRPAPAARPRLLGGDRRRGCCSPTSRPASSATRTATTSSHLIHSLGDDFGTTIVVVTHQPEVAATFPRTVTMKGGRVGAEGRDGSEYAVVGEDGVLHLPAHVAAEWPPGTLVRFEEDEHGRLLVSRSDGEGTTA